jgi:hypothetical protein
MEWVPKRTPNPLLGTFIPTTSRGTVRVAVPPSRSTWMRAVEDAPTPFLYITTKDDTLVRTRAVNLILAGRPTTRDETSRMSRGNTLDGTRGLVVGECDGERPKCKK